MMTDKSTIRLEIVSSTELTIILKTIRKMMRIKMRCLKIYCAKMRHLEKKVEMATMTCIPNTSVIKADATGKTAMVLVM